MNGQLTTYQQWGLDHITRCSCGSWQVVTDRELARRAEGFPPAPCPHINHAAMEAS